MHKLRWGVLSTAVIGVIKVIPALQRGKHTEVTAIASRDLERARAAASELGIAKAYGSYEELLADPQVDAIYNPLPNHLHVPWSIRALDAGKHVLCEKPLALSAAEAQTLVEAARNHPHLKVMEAFMYRFHPQWQRAREIVAKGGIGELRTVHTFFSYFTADPRDIRNLPEMGGGAMMDVGCYAISVPRFLFGAEPRRLVAVSEEDPQFGIDRIASGILEFDTGTATFTCSTQLARHQRVNIVGTEGRVEIPVPFNPAPDQTTVILHQQDSGTEEIVIPKSDQYTLQGDAFTQAVLHDLPVPTPLEDGVANMRTIEAVFESARTRKWAELPRPE